MAAQGEPVRGWPVLGQGELDRGARASVRRCPLDRLEHQRLAKNDLFDRNAGGVQRLPGRGQDHLELRRRGQYDGPVDGVVTQVAERQRVEGLLPVAGARMG